MKMKGLLRRSRVIQFENVKTPAQAHRRTVLLESADIASLARALTLTPQELVDAWSWDVDRQADAALTSLVARTGTDSLVAQTAEAASQYNASIFLTALTPRLAPGQRSELAEKVLRTRGSASTWRRHCGRDGAAGKSADRPRRRGAACRTSAR